MCETVRAAGGGGDGGGDASPALSDDAGCYVCNYAYFRALRRFPRRRVGFVHVPPVAVMPLERQRATLGEIVELVQRLAVE